MNKVRMQGASWDSLFLAFAKILTMLFSILLSKMLSVGLSLEMYGTYSQANLINSLGASLIALGFSDAINYFYNRREDVVDPALRIRIVNTVFFLEIVLGVVLAVAIWLGQQGIIAYFNNEALYKLIPMVAILPVLSNLLYFYQVLFVSVGKAKSMAIFNLVMIVVKLAITFVAVFVLQNLLFIFLGLILLEIGQLILFNCFVSRQGVSVYPWRISARHIKEIFSYALPIGIYTITSSLARELDKLVIGKLETTEVLAVYTNCSKLLPFDVLVISFATVLIPHIVRAVTSRDNIKGIALFSSYMKIGYYSVWIMATAVLIAPQTVISLLYADVYAIGTGIFVVYVFDSILRFASVHLVLTAANKSKLLLVYSVLSLAINLVLNVALYHMIGIIGPAVATLISSVIYTWLILRQTRKILHAKWGEIFAFKEMLWLILTLGLGWLLASEINTGLLYLGINKYIAFIISAGLFGCGMLAIHFKKIFTVLKEINTFRI